MSDEEDAVPISVRLGEVVPPEDPEDWTRPLTWVAALGMLAAPILVLGWFVLAPPAQGSQALPLTQVAAAALAGGAAATGATQQGVARAATATLGAGLFAGLVVVIVGVVLAGERQVEVASPTLAHGFAAAAGGLAGAGTASLAAAATARAASRPVRFGVAFAIGVAVALLAVGWLLPA